MIKLKITDAVISSLLHIVWQMITDLKIYKEQRGVSPDSSWERMEITGHLYLLEQLKYRLVVKRTKQNYSIKKVFTFSINPMEAYSFMRCTGRLQHLNEFDRLTLEQVKQPICQKLLA